MVRPPSPPAPLPLPPLTPPLTPPPPPPACIALQLAVTGLRCFYTNEKYERFRRTNKAMSA